MNYHDQIVRLTNEEAELDTDLINKINDNIPRINKIDEEFISKRGEIDPPLVAAAIRKLVKYATDAPNVEAQSMTQQINHAKKLIAKVNTIIPEEMTNEEAVVTLELLDQVLRHCRSFEKPGPWARLPWPRLLEAVPRTIQEKYYECGEDYEVFSLLDKIATKLESVRSELASEQSQPLNDLWKQLHRRSSKTYTVDYKIRCTFSYESGYPWSKS